MTSLAQALSNPKPSHAESLNCPPNAMPKWMPHKRYRNFWVLVINTGGTIGMKRHDEDRETRGLLEEPEPWM
ncbi:unnamed protein product [Gadus morhua 'NCC']